MTSSTSKYGTNINVNIQTQTHQQDGSKIINSKPI